MQVTSGNDRANALRFLGYLQERHNVQVTGLVSVFASPRLPHVTEQFVQHMVNERCVKYSTAAKMVLSVASIARFTHTMVKRAGGANASKLDAGALTALGALHQQCVQQSRKQDALAVGTPARWLDWSECQLARVQAERCASADGGLDALHDRCLLTLLTYQPPDRVKVMRTLQLGVSLIDTGDLYKLSIDRPDAHKTAVAFGPTKTTMPRPIATAIRAYAEAARLKDGMFLFYSGEDASKPLEPYAWTRLVKRAFWTYLARMVALAPKELRASFVTFLKSNEHSDATLKAAATAMRHSSKMQASRAYDKTNDEAIAAAVRVAEAYAARFSRATVAA